MALWVSPFHSKASCFEHCPWMQGAESIPSFSWSVLESPVWRVILTLVLKEYLSRMDLKGAVNTYPQEVGGHGLNACSEATREWDWTWGFYPSCMCSNHWAARCLGWVTLCPFCLSNSTQYKMQAYLLRMTLSAPGWGICLGAGAGRGHSSSTRGGDWTLVSHILDV